jgi:hypothetical protein
MVIDAVGLGRQLLDVLAEQQRNTGPEFGKASPIGLVVVLLLLIGTVLLVRSMNRHLRKLPESFDPGTPGPDQAVDDGTAQPDGEQHPADNGSSSRDPG